jgi:hypothetical protein
MSKKCGCGCCCCCGPTVQIVTVTEVDIDGGYYLVIDGGDFEVFGSVAPTDVEEVVAYVESESGQRIYGDRIRQVFDLYDWGFVFTDVPVGTAFKLIVQATDRCGCRGRAVQNIVCLAFAAAPMVRISYPGNSPPPVGGSYFESAGWCSDSGATFTATLTRGGNVIANGTLIPQAQGSFYTWKFSFTNVPVSVTPNDTTLTVSAQPQGGGASSSDSRTLSID